MRVFLSKRPTLALLAIAAWLCFASLPPAETRQLYLKLTGQITGDPNIKVSSSTFKQNGGEGSRLVLDVSTATSIDTTTVTNTSSMATASLSNGQTNLIITVTSSTTNQVTAITPGVPVCTDGSVTDVLTVTTLLLSNGSAFGRVIFSNNQTFIPLSETNETVNTAVTSTTNSTTICLGGNVDETIMLTTVLTNTVTTISVTNVITDAMSILLVDKQGNIESTFFVFDTINGINTSDTSERFMATGSGVDFIDDTNGVISFANAVLTGNIHFTSNDQPRIVSATMQADGDVDGSDFVFTGKLNADNPFVAAPTNFNQSAKPR